MKILLHILVLVCLVNGPQDLVKLDRDEFSISYPSHLQLEEIDDGAVVIVLKTELDGDTDIFSENINLATKSLPNQSFEEFVQSARNEIKTVANLEEEKVFVLNGNKCLRLKCSITQNNMQFTFVQHVYVVNKKAYALTFTSETKAFDTYFEEMNAVMMSFKIK